METQPEWLTGLWDELTAEEQVTQVRLAGDWIVFITQTLLPQLGEYRRHQVTKILAEPDWDAQKLAETIGARPDTIRRLAREWRRGYA